METLRVGCDTSGPTVTAPRHREQNTHPETPRHRKYHRSHTTGSYGTLQQGRTRSVPPRVILGLWDTGRAPSHPPTPGVPRRHVTDPTGTSPRDGSMVTQTPVFGVWKRSHPNETSRTSQDSGVPSTVLVNVHDRRRGPPQGVSDGVSEKESQKKVLWVRIVKVSLE